MASFKKYKIVGYISLYNIYIVSYNKFYKLSCNCIDHSYFFKKYMLLYA